MDIVELLERMMEQKASDMHITVANPPIIRVNGEMKRLDYPNVTDSDAYELTKQILRPSALERLEEEGEVDTSYSQPGLGRYRLNAYKQRDSYCLAIRSVAQNIASLEQLGLPPLLKDLAMLQRGLILVTGPTGSGKSTTLASMIDYANKNRSSHILTLEDPIEYLHKHAKSIVNQREIGTNSKSFGNALRAALRQDPDVILVGEMRDFETISIAITAAETGHLVLSTLHTIGAAKTIDRVIDVFPPYQQQQVRVQLAGTLEAVVSQQLLAKADGKGRAVALELMTVTPAIRNLIREGKTHQIQTSVQTGAKFGMKSMDNSLIDLCKQGIITKDAALNHSIDREAMERYIG